MKCLRFVEGQLNEAGARVSSWEEDVPFLLALRGNISVLAPVALLGADGAIAGRLCTLCFSPLAVLCGSGRPFCGKRQQLLTGEARGCSVCHFCELIHSAGEAPQYLPLLSGMNLATFAPFVCSEA